MTYKMSLIIRRHVEGTDGELVLLFNTLTVKIDL